MSAIPKYVLEAMDLKTTRQFKSRKRKELREIEKAVKEYQRGCAYCPGYETGISNLFKSVREIKILQSVKEWGN